METDLITVREEDILEFVAEMMDWRKIRYIPVEDIKGNLTGLVTSRMLLRQLVKHQRLPKNTPTRVGDIMEKKPITITTETLIEDAIKIMAERQIGCLPVVNGKELVGIVTESDFMKLAGRLISRSN